MGGPQEKARWILLCERASTLSVNVNVVAAIIIITRANCREGESGYRSDAVRRANSPSCRWGALPVQASVRTVTRWFVAPFAKRANDPAA